MPGLPSWMMAPTPQADVRGETLPMQVASRRLVADGIVEFLLCPVEGQAPVWEPGAHIDVHLPEAMVRQYSVFGDPADRGSLRIAVLLEPDGRGGSRYLHEHIAVGDVLEMGVPRNNFALQDAEQYVFVAGGIGITALLPMLAEVESRGRDWTLTYLGRSRSTMAYLDAFAPSDRRVTIVTGDSRAGRWDAARFFREARPATAIYCCGPERLLADVEAASAHWPPGSLHVERFKPRPTNQTPPRAFNVRLMRTGTDLQVPSDHSLLEVVEQAGLRVPSSCREGTCGTCEVMVLDGEPEHHDSVLSAEEAAVGDCMMICVSRAKGTALTIDL